MNHIVSRGFLFILLCGSTVGCAVKQPAAPAVAAAEVVPAPDTTAVEVVPVTSKGSYQPAAERLVDLLHTKLNVRFDWAKQHLLGEATLTLTPYFYPQNQVVLDAKGFDVHQVSLRKGKQDVPLTFDYDQHKLTLELDKTYSRKDTLQLFISYTAKPNELTVKGSSAIQADKGLYFINPLGKEEGVPQQIWTQGETEASSAWFPTIDKPNERMTQELYITVEDRFKTLSNGTLVSSQKTKNGLRTDHWRLSKPHAPYLAMMAIGEFAVVKDKWRNLEVSYWVEPEYAATAKATFGRTPAMLEFFSQKLGVPFPWEKYAQVVVRDFVSGAMENTTASTFMQALHQDRRELLDKNWDHIIAHELFHQWFGDLVTTESWANLPLNESFADYSEYLWAEHKYGPDEAALTHQTALLEYLGEAKTKQEPLIRYHYLDKEDMFDSHSYAKGGRVLHMLRQEVGEEAFFASLNLYLTRHKYTAVEIDELRMAFEDITGRDLQPFFKQWFLTPGHPELLVRHRFQNDTLTVQVTQTQDTVRTTVYDLPLTIAILQEGTWQEKEVRVTKAEQTFAFPASKAPQTVTIDPKQTILARITHEKPLEEWAAQFLQGNGYALKSTALEQLRDTTFAQVDQVIQQAIKDPFWKIRSTGLEMLVSTPAIQKPEVQAQIQQLALTDPNSTVRAIGMYALSTLSGLPPEIVEKGLQDSSYQVVSAAIFAWSRGSHDLNRLKPFLTYKNPDVVNALAAAFTANTEDELYGWYLKNAQKLRGGDLFYFLQSFGAYLLKKNIDDQERGWQALVRVVERETLDIAKQTAFQMLTLMAETDDRRETLQKLVEKDPKLGQLMGLQQN
ncbi:M1 family aminopeptidase [Rufibacter glacialis]|uniref:Aminopeptidase N n=1 Tax=Rufibacter glacialis TaxID=1259555 RepID=A0A5M8QSV6_9BACT|nr:M1 family metallopeptidase [Rufibacter glacialis]KAA6437282.1 M1 family peptidase [Rufibacter glacialis]GGK60440.1 aminopeptidase [Rufibacter glacialis]